MILTRNPILCNSYTQQGDPNSANAQKKAAKKAEKAAKKAAIKAGEGGGGAVTPPFQENKAPPAKSPSPVPAATTSAKTPPSQPAAAKKSTGIPVAAAQAVLKRLEPGQLTWNPYDNDGRGGDLPLAALTTAVLSNTILDYTLQPDKKAPTVALGLAAADNVDGRKGGTGVVQGDIAVARYMARQTVTTTLYPTDDPNALAVVDMWLDYAASLSRLEPARQWQAAVLTLEKALRAGRTFCTGHSLTLADVVMFRLLGFPTTEVQLTRLLDQRLSATITTAPQTRRWCRTLAVHPALQEATQLATATGVEITDDFCGAPTVEPLVPGMNALEGAVPGRVVTRFPPEPSGYLHIGHAKAVLLNDYYARRYKGRLILRFDDTNPSKEKEEYQESIVVDLAKLDVKPTLVTYASDYFAVCMGYAKQMIEEGLAYMDDTPQEQMKTERMQRVASKHRHQTPAEALEKFELMCSGAPEGAAWCLRAQLDMTSNNGTLRDPVLYRQNLTPHHRTGTTYKAYPTYDFSWCV